MSKAYADNICHARPVFKRDCRLSGGEKALTLGDGLTAAAAAHDADARPIGFLADIEGDAVSGEEHDAGEAGCAHHVVALEGRGPYAYLRDVLAR